MSDDCLKQELFMILTTLSIALVSSSWEAPGFYQAIGLLFIAYFDSLEARELRC